MIKKCDVQNIRAVVRTVALIFLLLNSCVSFSQGFYSEKLHELYNKLPYELKSDNRCSDCRVIKTMPINNDTVKIVFDIDKSGIFTHVGWRFVKGIDTQETSKTVADFWERHFVKYLLYDNPQIISNFEFEKHIQFFRNNSNGEMILLNRNNIVGILNNATGIKTVQNTEFFVSQITCADGSVLFAKAPVNEDVILEMDKKERDDFIGEQIKNFKNNDMSFYSIDNDYIKVYKDSLYVYEGSYYMIPEMNNNLFLEKTEGNFNVIYSKELVPETFVNTFLLQSSRNYTINITQRKYGFKKDYYKVRSNDFFGYFNKDYDRYFGVETANKNNLKGTLIFRHKELNFIHLVYVQCTMEQLLTEGEISVELTANIPQNNILNLFGKEEKK